MPLFRYTAIGRDGALQRGTMEAANEQAVIATLRRAGSMPMRAESAGSGGVAGLISMPLGRGASLSRQEVADITRELAIMLGAGQDLDRALRFLVETAASARARGVITRLREAVRDGSPFAAALAQHPRSFSRLYVGLVRAGESGGQLAATLDRLALMLERQRSLAAAVTSAMIYPSILVVGAVGSIVLLLTHVVPQFVPLFAQNGAALPRPTQLLIDLGDAVSAYGLYTLAGLVLLAVAGRQILLRPGARLGFDRAVLHVPVLGGLLRELLAARFTRTLGTLLINGVPLIAALAIVREVIGNTAGMAAVEQATGSAKAGAGLSGPLAEAGIFPPRTVYLLRLGEETAQLGAMALRAAEIHEETTRLGVQRLVSLLVPAITIVMGAAVAGIVSALLLAMLSLNDLAN